MKKFFVISAYPVYSDQDVVLGFIEADTREDVKNILNIPPFDQNEEDDDIDDMRLVIDIREVPCLNRKGLIKRTNEIFGGMGRKVTFGTG